MEYTFKAIQGKQWNKTTYTAQIPFARIATIGKVDVEVQREADSSRMDNIADYILKPYQDNTVSAAFNALVTSLRYVDLIYDKDKSEIRISTRAKLYICDGQHRFGGIVKAVNRVEENLEEATNKNDIKAIDYWQNILKNLDEMTIPVVIFTGLKIEEEKQLFHDLNKLGVQVNQTKALSLDKNDIYNRIARQLVEEIDCVKEFGINNTAKNLSDKNREIATLGTWNYCMRIFLNGSKDMKKPWNSIWSFEEKKNECLVFWREIFDIMPDDFVNREKYMITKAAFIQGIAEFGYNITRDKSLDLKKEIAKLKGFDWGYYNDEYSKYGGGAIVKNKNKKGKEMERFYFKGTRAAINSVSAVLEDYIKR
jgi:DGQHR domain-containing protein